MKKLVLLISFISFIGCSTDDDCTGDRQEINDMYDTWLENDNLTDFERQQLKKERDAKLENAC